MSTTSMKQNVLYGLSEGGSVANATFLTYALRYLNAAYREIFLRYRFKCLKTRSIFRTTDGQQTYQAPSDFSGFLVMKDETSGTILDQVTPEELQREVTTTEVTNEDWTSTTLNTAVALGHQGLVQYSETVTNVAGTVTYTRDTDYSMSYTAGTITPISGQLMAATTAYHISYLYYEDGAPTQFCLEYDATNKRYVFRLSPTPDATYITSLLYPALPSDLSGSVEPLWSALEFALERGGIYYGSLEILDDPQKRSEFKTNYETAMAALIQADQEMEPKQMTIPLHMKRIDHKG